MRTGLLFILLGGFWILIAILTCRGRRFSTYFYPLAGLAFIIWGMWYVLTNATLSDVIIFILVLTAVILAALYIYGRIKLKDEEPTEFSEVTTPEPTAEELYLSEVYGSDGDESSPDDLFADHGHSQGKIQKDHAFSK